MPEHLRFSETSCRLKSCRCQCGPRRQGLHSGPWNWSSEYALRYEYNMISPTNMWISPATLLKTNGQLTPFNIIISTCTIMYIWGCYKIFGEFGVSVQNLRLGSNSTTIWWRISHSKPGMNIYTQSYIHQLGMEYTTHKSGNFGDGLFFGLSGLPHYCICIFSCFFLCEMKEMKGPVGLEISNQCGCQSQGATMLHWFIKILTNWKVTVMAMATSYNWLFLWDYTFYKWGFVSTYNW